jgi:hypothetical protein
LASRGAREESAYLGEEGHEDQAEALDGGVHAPVFDGLDHGLGAHGDPIPDMKKMSTTAPYLTVT